MGAENKDTDVKEEKGYKYFWPIVIFAIALVTSLWIYNYKYGYGLNYIQRGIFGDMFGAVNAVFSGLAFAGIIISLYLQRIDLKNQFEEIQQTNREFRIQNETMELQKFENRFFKMLSIHHQIVENIDSVAYNLIVNDSDILWHLNDNPQNISSIYNQIFSNPPIAIKSRDVFKVSLGILQNFIGLDLKINIYAHHLDAPILELKDTNNNFNKILKFKNSIIVFNGQEIESKFESIYKYVYDKLDTDYGHYFRNLYRIIKIIDNTEFNINPIDNFWTKYEYISIVRAQLSDDETKWLFYNCLTDKGRKKFKPLIEKYALLKLIYQEDPIFSYYKDLYLSTAYKKPSEEDVEAHIKRFMSLENEN